MKQLLNELLHIVLLSTELWPIKVFF